jgi:acyl-homoserine lactone acylase PvdQ
MVARSVPLLDGEIEIAGLASPVTIERDALGVPTIRGSSRLDVAQALGFLHAQERFFQMDLMRRQAAGELSELLAQGHCRQIVQAGFTSFANARDARLRRCRRPSGRWLAPMWRA